MRARSVYLIALLMACATQASGQAYRYDGEPSGQYLRTWLIAGPFDGGAEHSPDVHLADFETDFLGGEFAVRPQPGDAAGESTWRLLTADTDAVDLDAAVSNRERVIAYAYVEIESGEQQACILALGSNDGVRVRVNGEPVWDHPAGRPLALDQDLVPIILAKGTNRILLKIEERGNQWGFAARLLPITDEIIAKLELFRVETAKNGQATLNLRYHPTLFDTFLRNPHVTVRDLRTNRVVWSSKLDYHKTWPIDVDTKDYGRYRLDASFTIAGHGEQGVGIPFEAGRRVEHALFENAATDYTIVVADDASDSERWAANELQRWLKEVSGADFPVATNANGPAIYVGLSDAASKLLDGVEAPDPADESFTYRNAGPSIVIYGGRERGTMYGVMSFLERELGVRFYTPRVTVTPKRERYTFTYLHHTEAPQLRVRNDFYFEAFDSTWAARNRVNGTMGQREQPGGLEGYWSVHTFYPLLPPDEFFDTHPEYFSLIDGKRTTERAQLCLTNPDVLDILTERLLKVMEEQPDYLIYSVSQNDWYGACQCGPCQAIAQREGSESGPMIWFVNQVAERVEPRFPDKYVGTLAYQYTRHPPKTLRPRDNVVVRLCSIECCFAHDFASCPENAAFLDDLQRWAAISPQLYIWDYVVNFSHYVMPYPNFKVLAPNLRAFRDNRAIGVMEQGAYQSRGGEFCELRAYVLAKLLWNADADVDDIVDDFMYGYYGRAGQHVRRYFDSLHAQLTPDTHIHLGLQPTDALFTDAWIAEADAIFDAAERVADDQDILHRVELARLPLLYLKWKRDPKTAAYDGTYTRLETIEARENVTHYSEAGARK